MTSKNMDWYDENADADWITCKKCRHPHREYSRGFCYDCFKVLVARALKASSRGHRSKQTK